MKATYNKSKIMRNAWYLKRANASMSFSACLKKAWRNERAEYWKGVRDYIEQGDRLIEAHQRIIELTKELTECRDILAGRRTINQYQCRTSKLN